MLLRLSGGAAVPLTLRHSKGHKRQYLNIEVRPEYVPATGNPTYKYPTQHYRAFADVSGAESPSQRPSDPRLLHRSSSSSATHARVSSGSVTDSPQPPVSSQLPDSANPEDLTFPPLDAVRNASSSTVGSSFIQALDNLQTNSPTHARTQPPVATSRDRSPPSRDADHPSQRRRLRSVRDRTPTPTYEYHSPRRVTSPTYSPTSPDYDPAMPYPLTSTAYGPRTTAYTLYSPTSPANPSSAIRDASAPAQSWPEGTPWPSRSGGPLGGSDLPTYGPATNLLSNISQPSIPGTDNMPASPDGSPPLSPARPFAPPRVAAPAHPPSRDSSEWNNCPVRAITRDISAQIITQLRQNLTSRLSHPSFSSTPAGVFHAYEAAATAVVADMTAPSLPLGAPGSLPAGGAAALPPAEAAPSAIRRHAFRTHGAGHPWPPPEHRAPLMHGTEEPDTAAPAANAAARHATHVRAAPYRLHPVAPEYILRRHDLCARHRAAPADGVVHSPTVTLLR